MSENSLLLVEEYFKKARRTDELLPNSVIKYRESIKRFLYTVGNKNFSELEIGDFENFVNQAKEKKNDNSGIRSVLYAVIWIMKKLQGDGTIDKRVDLEKIEMPKIKKKDVIYLTEEEIKKFFNVIEKELEKSDAIRKIRTMTLYIFLLETGARISEALSIKVRDIDFENGEIPIIGKGEKPRALFIHSRSIYWIKRYLEKRKDNNEYLFVNRSGKGAWTYGDVCRSSQRYKILSGIYKDYSIHTFRHTFATQLLFNNVPISHVSYLLGHKNLETTIKYYIGVIKKAEAKEFIKDSHFDFIPESALKAIH